MDTKHTPGPWTVTVDPDACGRYDIREHAAAEYEFERRADHDDANADAIYEEQSELREANKRLIAHAPELLRVLEYLAGSAEPFSERDRLRALDVIARAKGGAA
jgi:hypothetical protein